MAHSLTAHEAVLTVTTCVGSKSTASDVADHDAVRVAPPRQRCVEHVFHYVCQVPWIAVKPPETHQRKRR
ncbi:hypothetical protein ABB37_08026 [Leptomonas pyrrhocoris]|uniref:Uncharacterized protein n=1 Tax=Leptomonas pyrrhocoris TaxID=157538 RepID=A0A0N0VDR3_LEPPY|nr:hypothetical protein ABB37_08026 [Leptomonas pyrrhocoris]XP_015654742.1 hypothetical protein ABB37_08026 [Leptomonas pyrrhocoris]XP_015654743.1 hypothetical protein ABB37_08026 [Leptomonas pyrrhocoris]KPA76302.1 hypothetical protein ABB37_08026 [Leptomonas pyrrhocoris]KPA76303.1 hypothetical protein ABB37_08026 [Leptomonas pyrrhocoris]KPA76304.1 hypothetical protein ABB37_08026 [Leptomonas pyrrhocoris]|eukprot:XP_015654741.1 hypothetical protein ABB37_08026 [Leptomonas pyrrhocoris]